MAKITQDFINGLGSLYEEIQTKDTDFLNEESKYYDEELSELSEDIFLSIALSMFSEGYSAETFLKFLSSSEEEVILEKYLSTDVTLLSEEVVYADFVEEQLELLEARGGAALRGMLQSIVGGLKSTRNAARSGVTRAATAGVERRVGRQLLGRKGIDIQVPGSRTGRSGSSMERTTAALEKLSKSKAQKSGISVPSGRLDARQSTELLKQARTAQAIKGVKSAAKGALVAGLGVLGGYTAAKLGGGGSGGGEGSTDGPKTSPEDKAKWNASAALGGQAAFKAGGGAAKMKQNPEMTAADVQKLGMANLRRLASTGDAPPAAAGSGDGGGAGGAGGGGGAGSGGGSPSGQRVTPAKPPKPPTPAKPTDGAERRAATSAELAAAQKARKDALEAGKSKEEAEKAAVQAGIDRGTKLMGGPEGPGEIDTKDVEASIKAEQERQRKRAEKKASESQTTTAKESYDAYDIILEYLMNTEQAETLDEAHYIMLEMDESAVGNIMEEYENYLLSEEIHEWVNSLLNEGYDFSEYTWDDVVEYYLNEAKYGTEKGRKKLAKKVRAGKDVGKKGGGFEEIVKKASPKYGKERATKIAAAAMWKNLGK